ncbi:MAG: ACP S-malonyltransferase [Acidimicrobiia bacterium]
MVRVAVIFPGQGTQQPGMANAWRDHPSWAVVDRAEAALGEPLAHLITDAPADALTRTREAQLSVLLTSLIVWDALAPQLDAIDLTGDAQDSEPVVPVAFAGHSLGQVTALIAAGVLPFDDGIRFAARRAELTQAAADAHPGRMAALLGATPEQAVDACTAAPDGCWVANDNAPGQVVIAGTPDGVAAGSERAKEIGVKRATPLNVGGAFHTPLMHDASAGLVDILATVQFAPTTVPVVSNHDAVAYTDADGWRVRLADHVSVPVRWRSTMDTLVELGATTFVEVGHGGMLAALAKRGAPGVTMRNIATPDDIPSAPATPPIRVTQRVTQEVS